MAQGGKAMPTARNRQQQGSNTARLGSNEDATFQKSTPASTPHHTPKRNQKESVY